MNRETIESVINYHEETKHYFHRTARSAGYMDWKNQPDPFRTYTGAPVTPLPAMDRDIDIEYMGLYRRRTGSQPFDITRISAFMGLSMGLSAWKSAGGSRWALRMNPSSGNLHPTEVYPLLPSSEGIESGLYHYHPLHHALEQRAKVPDAVWEKLNTWFGGPVILAGLTSIFWREAWKYGERAFRYCQLDVGHALAALSFSAALQGWKITALTGLSDDAVEAVLGLNRTEWHDIEADHPDLLCALHAPDREIPRTLSDDIITDLSELPCIGVPPPLSRQRVSWDIIYEIAENTHKPETVASEPKDDDPPFYEGPVPRLTAANIIRQRRSAVAFRHGNGISRNRFLYILDKTLPRSGGAPFEPGLGNAKVDLLIFVHQVDGLENGLYYFARTREGIKRIRDVTSPRLLWEKASRKLPLYLLEKRDFRKTAALLSCRQEIAGDSAFSLGMIARFRDVVTDAPHRYRHLFWECGQIGQVLYLEAEAQGLRGTGIGCFFDDPVHELIGLNDNQFQSLYHFTIGDPIEDRRLMTHLTGYR